MGVVVEVAHNQQLWIAASGHEAICGPFQLAGGHQPVGLAFLGAAGAGREVGDQYVQRVAVQQQAAGMQYVACGAVGRAWFAHGDAVAGKQFEQSPLVEQGYIDAPFISGVGHNVSVTGFAYDGVAGQVA